MCFNEFINDDVNDFIITIAVIKCISYLIAKFTINHKGYIVAAIIIALHRPSSRAKNFSFKISLNSMKFMATIINFLILADCCYESKEKVQMVNTYWLFKK